MASRHRVAAACHVWQACLGDRLLANRVGESVCMCGLGLHGVACLPASLLLTQTPSLLVEAVARQWGREAGAGEEALLWRM